MLLLSFCTLPPIAAMVTGNCKLWVQLAFAEYKDDEPEDKLRTRDSERLKLRKSKEINIKMHKLEKYFRNNKLTVCHKLLTVQ